MPFNKVQLKTLRDTLKVAVDEIINLEDKKDNSGYLTEAIKPIDNSELELVSILPLLESLTQIINIAVEVRNCLLQKVIPALKQKNPLSEEALAILKNYPSFDPVKLAEISRFRKNLEDAKVKENVITMLIRVREAYLEMAPLGDYNYGVGYITFSFTQGQTPFNLESMGDKPGAGEISDQVESYVEERLELFADYREQYKKLENESIEEKKSSMDQMEPSKQIKNSDKPPISSTSQSPINNNNSSAIPSTHSSIHALHNFGSPFSHQQSAITPSSLASTKNSINLNEPKLNILLINDTYMESKKTEFIKKVRSEMGRNYTMIIGGTFFTVFYQKIAFSLWDMIETYRYASLIKIHLEVKTQCVFLFAHNLESLKSLHQKTSDELANQQSSNEQIRYYFINVNNCSGVQLSQYLTSNKIEKINLKTYSSREFEVLFWQTYQNYCSDNKIDLIPVSGNEGQNQETTRKPGCSIS